MKNAGESKREKVKAFYNGLENGFQSFGVLNKFVGIHLYVAYTICRTLPTSN